MAVILGLSSALGVAAGAQKPLLPIAQPVPESTCCGPITSAGQALLDVLVSMDVEHRWLENRRVDWRTGAPDGPMHISSKPDTHCSAFAAAAGHRLGVYMLRPPEHPQLYLASAQGRWFPGEEAHRKGWVQVMTTRDAQRLANEGELVVLNFINPVPGQHGHIAIVRPYVKTDAQLAQDGPETMQAGKSNFEDGNAVRSFHSHEGAWPDHVTMWAHHTRLQGAFPDVDAVPPEDLLPPAPLKPEAADKP